MIPLGDKELGLRGYVKAGYKTPDPSEGHMNCYVIVLSQNDV